MKTKHTFIFILLLSIKVLYAQVDCPPPSPISPTGNNWIVDAPTFVWHPVTNPDSGCEGYFIRVGFYACNWYSDWIVYIPSITDSCYTMPLSNWIYFEPMPGFYYDWAMLTWNGWQVACCGSIMRYQNVLPYTYLQSPSNNETNINLTPTLSWSNVTGAGNYLVSIYKTPTFLYWHYDTTVSSTTMIVRPGVLSTAKNYWWKVKPYNSSYIEAPFSDPFMFQTTFTGIPAIPIQYAPPNGAEIHTFNPTLDWDSILNANTYTVQLASNPNFTTIIYSNANITNSFVTISGGLNYSTYYWRVKAVNSYGSSQWSCTDSFSITSPYPPAPNLVSPPNGTIGQSVTPLLDWDSAAIASSYQVQVSKDSNFSNLVLDSSSIINTNVQIPGGRLLPDSIYYWKVRGSNIIGQGPWSSVWNFRVSPLPPAPDLISPVNGAVGQSLTPKLDWALISSADNYRVQISLDSNFGGIPILDSVLIADSLIVPSNLLLNNTRYYWRVYAKNIAGSGPWSSVWHFNTLLVGTGNNYTEIPKEFKLYTNYPNPFNPITIIKFDIPKEIHVKIVIYDVLGKTIQMLLDANIKAGKYEIEWDGTNHPSGVYFYKLETGEYTSVKKMVLLK